MAKASSPYREIFKAKGSAQFSCYGLIARMPFAMLSISLIAMFKQLGTSYSEASYIAAAYVVACAIFAPQLSRLADLFGQSKIIIMGTSIASVSLIALLLAAHYGAPTLALMLLAVGCGFLPSFGAFVRARWSALYRDAKRLHAAFALESIFDEIIYIIGPVIALFLTTNISPSSGSLTALVFLIIGSIAFVRQKQTEPPPYKDSAADKKSVLHMAAIRSLAFTLLGIGAIYGAVEITVLAFAQQLGKASMASLPIASYALGSCITGIIYGNIAWRMKLSQRFFILIILAAIATLPLLFASNLTDLSIMLFLAGATCSPTFIISTSLIENIVPKHKLTEGMSWASTGMSIGTSIGAATAGPIIDKIGAVGGFYVAVASAAFALIAALTSYNELRKYG